MLFNSLDFAIFFPVVFALYWFVANKNLRFQNILLLLASYFFYGSWDYRFLFLLIFSTFLDYYTGLKIYQADHQRKRKFWLWLSVCVNLGFLGFFKYYNFFVSSFTKSISFFGLEVNVWTLQIILPVGISFYTFHGLSYVFDIYNRKISPTTDYVDYAVFVSFFPLLVAGPIERATHLLPQVKAARKFEYEKTVDGMRQILWGLFKKIVIADNCAVHVNRIFADYADYNGSTLLWGAILFAFQIYCDFSGYSDIALGSARMLGFDLIRNFSYPYFARDIAEFWRRWHISLTTWFRDYLYIPLGGSKGSKWKIVRNTFIIFLVSGFWHGANWTFILWGLINAFYFLPLILTGSNRNHLDTAGVGRSLPSGRELLQIGLTFFMTTVAWIFFRATSIDHAVSYIARMASPSLLKMPERGFTVIPFILIMVATEWVQRNSTHGLYFPSRPGTPVRWSIYFALIVIIFCFGVDQQNFIYFQF